MSNTGKQINKKGVDKKKIDYGLYLVADRNLEGIGRSIEDIVERSIEGGVTVVQLREKNASAKDFIALAGRIHKITKIAGIPFIVNDRVDVALAIDADGAHVGQSDRPAAAARKMLGPKKILGVSARTVPQALQAEKDGADYLGVGDIFGTQSKSDAGKPIGLDVLRRIARSVKIPVVGIGGISLQKVTDVIASGARGVAVISAIACAKRPELAAKALKSAVTRAMREK